MSLYIRILGRRDPGYGESVSVIRKTRGLFRNWKVKDGFGESPDIYPIFREYYEFYVIQ